MYRLALLLIVLATPALADNSCASLPAGTQAQRNTKWYCRAQSEGNGSYCASIFGDLDLKRQCEARTGRPSSCASIMDRERRLYCQGVTGR
jgi:hypothetical protein